MGRETLGDILRSRKLVVHAGCCLAFDFTLIAYWCQDLWIEFYEIHEWGTYGLVVGNCLGFFASNITTISWVLVDDNSWLGKAVMLFVASLLLSIFGAHVTIQYFNFGSSLYTHVHKTKLPDSGNSTQVVTHKFSLWIPVLAGINFLQGIVGLMFFVLVCMIFDGENTSNK